MLPSKPPSLRFLTLSSKNKDGTICLACSFEPAKLIVTKSLATKSDKGSDKG